MPSLFVDSRAFFRAREIGPDYTARQGGNALLSIESVCADPYGTAKRLTRLLDL